MSASILIAQVSTDIALWFAVLGGAAGFVSLYLTLKRSRSAKSDLNVAPRPTAPAAQSLPIVTPAPATTTAPAPAPAARAADDIPGEVMALIAAAVAVTVGPNARIAAVHPTAPSLDLLQQWSVEGRRQIYSSHQIR